MLSNSLLFIHHFMATMHGVCIYLRITHSFFLIKIKYFSQEHSQQQSYGKIQKEKKNKNILQNEMKNEQQWVLLSVCLKDVDG